MVIINLETLSELESKLLEIHGLFIVQKMLFINNKLLPSNLSQLEKETERLLNESRDIIFYLVDYRFTSQVNLHILVENLVFYGNQLSKQNTRYNKTVWCEYIDIIRKNNLGSVFRKTANQLRDFETRFVMFSKKYIDQKVDILQLEECVFSLGNEISSLAEYIAVLKMMFAFIARKKLSCQNLLAAPAKTARPELKLVARDGRRLA
jgi:hypothetical protein